MKNVIVASFKEESKAIEALHKLNELDSFGDITIYDQMMVRKKEDGQIETLKQNDSEGWRTLTGIGVGSLLGLLGGPVGFVIGLYTGAAVGVIADASHYDFAEDFIAKVEKKIEIGTVTIIAEMEEYNEVFADNYLKPFGAVISRSDIDLEFDKHVNDQIDEIEAEIAEETAALKEGLGNEKKKIEAKIIDLKEKRKARIAEFVTKSKEVQKDIKTKALNVVAKVEAEIKAIGTNIHEDVKKEKIGRINKRIGRHENMLNELKMQLSELKN